MTTKLFLIVNNRHIKMDQVEKIVMDSALNFCGGDRAKAAKVLGVSRSTFYRKKPVKRKAGE